MFSRDPSPVAAPHHRPRSGASGQVSTARSVLGRLVSAVFTPPTADREHALRAMERTCALTHLVTSAEYLTQPGDRRTGGLNDWGIGRENFARLPRPVRATLDRIGSPTGTTVVHVSRVLAAAALLAPTGRRTRAGAGLWLAASGAAVYPRHHYGTDGADQVGFLVQSAAAVARMAPNHPRVADSALWYVALQSTLSYAVSGWVKVVSPTWRSGRALEGVMRTRTYGHEGVYRLVRRHPRIAANLTRSVVAMECVFPIVFLAGGRLARPLVASTAGFHAANAWLMGLGRFFTAFSAMHPAVLYATAPNPARTGGAPRHDELPRVAGAALAATAVAGLLDAALRDRRVRAGRPGDEQLITPAGNTLHFHRFARTSPHRPDPTAPVYVLDHGMVASGAHWAWVVAGLREHADVITYYRAGYGPSRRGTDRRGLQVAVDDLVALCRHTADGRPVVLVGHSLGGWLGLRAAAELERTGAPVAGVALVDASHPAELDRSPRQAKGAAGMSHNLQLLAPSLRAGLGWAMRRPSWVDRLPEEVRATALDEVRNHRIWAAGQREWVDVQAEFVGFDQPLPQIHAPLDVITAEATHDQDADQVDMHAELAACSPSGVHTVLPDCDHDTVLTSRDAATRLAGLLAALPARASTTTTRRAS